MILSMKVFCTLDITEHVRQNFWAESSGPLMYTACMGDL